MSLILCNSYQGFHRTYSWSRGEAEEIPSLNRRKYRAIISHNRSNSGNYYVSIPNPEGLLHQITQTRKEAEDFILANAKQRCNIIYPPSYRGGPYECSLGNDRFMLFDERDREVVDSTVWWYEEGAVITRDRKAGNKRICFSSIVLPPQTEEERMRGCRAYHSNGNPLDYRRANLIWKTPRQIKALITVGYRNNKSTGILGIIKKREVTTNGTIYTRFVAQWKGKSKSFSFKDGDRESEEEALEKAKECRRLFLLLL